MNRIPVSEPLIGDDEIANVTDCLRSGRISSAGANYVERFEELWAARCGRRHGVAVCNGSLALHLAFACLDLPEGSEVVVPTFTILSCVTAVLAAGLVPVFVDSDPRTWCLDPEDVRRKLGPRTRAILPVHVYGHPADMDPITDLAREHGLAVVEDAAEAHGAEYLVGRSGDAPTWRPCGSFGTASVFSFYANKPVTTGEGGMVLTDDGTLADALRSRRNLAFRPDRRFVHDVLGWNYRMTNLQGALGVAQVARLDATLERKRAMAAYYDRHLAEVPGLTLHVQEPWARSIHWMYGVVLEDDARVDPTALSAALDAAGIETRPFFWPMHEQPVFASNRTVADGSHPVASKLGRRGLYLPSGPTLAPADLARVVAEMRRVLG